MTKWGGTKADWRKIGDNVFGAKRSKQMTHITNDTIVALLNEDGSVEWDGPFADFCASNKFEDEEVAEIEWSLNAFHHFEGGGGALAGFTLVVF